MKLSTKTHTVKRRKRNHEAVGERREQTYGAREPSRLDVWVQSKYEKGAEDRGSNPSNERVTTGEEFVFVSHQVLYSLEKPCTERIINMTISAY